MMSLAESSIFSEIYNTKFRVEGAGVDAFLTFPNMDSKSFQSRSEILTIQVVTVHFVLFCFPLLFFLHCKN